MRGCVLSGRFPIHDPKFTINGFTVRGTRVLLSRYPVFYLKIPPCMVPYPLTYGNQMMSTTVETPSPTR